MPTPSATPPPDPLEQNEASLTGGEDGPHATWTPEPGRGIRLPDGRTVHKGVLFVPDGTGGGVLYGRSKTTMKWTRRIGSAKPYTGGTP